MSAESRALLPARPERTPSPVDRLSSPPSISVPLLLPHGQEKGERAGEEGLPAPAPVVVLAVVQAGDYDGESSPLTPPPLPADEPIKGKFRRCLRGMLTCRGMLLTVFVAALLTLLVLSAVPGSPVQDVEIVVLKFAQSVNRAMAAGVLAAAAIGFILFGLPVTGLNLAAGFILGPGIGGAEALLANTVGAILAFILGRTTSKKWAEARVKANPRLHAVSRAVARRGFLLIFLIRLSPVFPFAVVCYALGVTPVHWASYSLATFLGLAPFTFAYCYIGSLLSDFSSIWINDDDTSGSGDSSIGLTTVIWIIVALISTVLIIVIVTIVTRRALKKTLSEQPPINTEQEKVYTTEESLPANNSIL